MTPESAWQQNISERRETDIKCEYRSTKNIDYKLEYLNCKQSLSSDNINEKLELNILLLLL